jgi:hypothetical protein
MAEPLFPRKFNFNPLPLFSNTGHESSPWNTVVVKLADTDRSERQSLTTYRTLRDYSKEELGRNRTKLAGLVPGTKEFQILENKVNREEVALANSGGGAAQHPFINCDEYSFPIFEVKRENGTLVTTSLPMLPYQGSSFEPPWIPRTGDNQQGWTALDVPVPAVPVRPSGPENLVSDGNIILFDRVTKMEYDFWQATTLSDPAGHSLGGGCIGDRILRAGSVSAFDAYGLGARRPGMEPSGSSRASGLPYLGGALLPEDIACGIDSSIEHALIFALPSVRFFPDPQGNDPPNWVYPASRTEFSQGVSDAFALAAGQRIFLKDELYGRNQLKKKTQDILLDEAIPWIVRIFLRALNKYGAFLVDASGGFSLVAEDIHTAKPSLTPEQINSLVAPEPPDAGKTDWQLLIDTINDYLSHKLLDGSGLAFAYLDNDDKLLANFAVAEDMPPPASCKQD